MKTKNNPKKKLELKKTTVTTLDSEQLNTIKAGSFQTILMSLCLHCP